LGKGARIRYLAEEKQEENNLSSLEKMKKVPPVPEIWKNKRVFIFQDNFLLQK
jgi:hypothetical protein